MPDLEDEIEEIVSPILRMMQGWLKTILNGHAVTAYIKADREMVEWGRTKLTDRPIFYEGPPVKKAMAYAQKHGAQLVTQMDDETKKRLAQVVSDGIKNKRGVPGLAKDIRGVFADMTKYRSKLIATTETRQALFTASHDRSVDMGVTGKEWVLGAGGAEGNCPECMANAAVGVIPINDSFPNSEGDIHPGCTCAIAPAMLPA
ncbi:MAG: phage head morphogenesis protein [Gammaproteobacteria bacterium]|nr:phage head morphogenesis protein [Gammaproteobacteria bacterium]